MHDLPYLPCSNIAPMALMNGHVKEGYSIKTRNKHKNPNLRM